MTDFKPGDRVQLSGKFLRSTGQSAGGEGAKIWTVEACPCPLCAAKVHPCVRVDEERDELTLQSWTAEELAAHPYLRRRHIAACNLKHYGKPSLRDVY